MNFADIKKNNRKKIYYYIRDNGFATKQQISIELNLSLPTVSRTLEYLLELGLINSEDKISNRTGGRNPIAYTYVSDARLSIGLDICKNYFKCVVVDLDGNIVDGDFIKEKFDRSDDYFKILGDAVDNIINKNSIDKNLIIGVGIAVPGLIDSDNSRVLYGKVIPNEGMTLLEFSKYIDYPTKLIHDSYASGFNEVWMSPEMHNAFFITLGHSVGGSILLNHEVYEGEGICSGEIGHMNLVTNGKECYCGKKGCFDAYASADVLSSHSDGELDKFFELLEQGDEDIKAVWDEYLEHLSIIVNDLRMILGCVIIIGGLVGSQMGKYIGQLQEKVNAKNPFDEDAAQYVFPCKPHISTVARGAALFFVDDFLRRSNMHDFRGDDENEVTLNN